ncbi:helix-turn-helix domain-containing protein [Sphingomonas sp. UYP23]
MLGDKGLSNKELAERSALPADRVDRILDGRLVGITFRDITVIAAVLETPVYSLLVAANPTVEVVPLEIVEERASGDA